MNLFELIKSKVDIFDVIGGYLDLKRIGGYFKSSCPFHSEKDASFTISPHRQMYFCFGCKKSGDAISFIADYEQVTQLEAAKFLIDKYRLDIPDSVWSEQSGDFKEKKVNYYLLHEKIVKWCQQELAGNQEALSYLSQRGVSQESIDKFSIGFFPSNKNKKSFFMKKMLEAAILPSDFSELGIFNSHTDLFSPFEDRIIFPIFDSLGRCVGLGGRVFLPGDDRAKYYNSKESPLFEKKKLLFGFWQAKNSISKQKSAILVEGYLDTILMHQAQHTQTVATLGTSFSKEHISFLEKMINTLFVMYDGDDAGVNAMLKFAQISFETKIDLKIVLLDKKLDPADMAISHPEELLKKIEDAKDAIEFFIHKEGLEFLQLDQAQKIKRLEKIFEVINKVQNKLKKYLLLQKISYLTGIKYNFLERNFSTKNNTQSLGNSEATSKSKEDTLSHNESLFFYSLISSIKEKPFVWSDDLNFIFEDNFCTTILESRACFSNFDDCLNRVNEIFPEKLFWFQDNYSKIEQEFDSINIRFLLKKCLMDYVKKNFLHCSRTADLEKEEERRRISLIMEKVNNIRIFLRG